MACAQLRPCAAVIAQAATYLRPAPYHGPAAGAAALAITEVEESTVGTRHECVRVGATAACRPGMKPLIRRIHRLYLDHPDWWQPHAAARGLWWAANTWPPIIGRTGLALVSRCTAKNHVVSAMSRSTA